MFRKFISLEWKAFFRASSFSGNMVMKIFMIIGAIYFGVMLLSAGILTYKVIHEEMHQDPLVVVSQYMIYYMLADLLLRVFMQKIPIINIKPLLTLPIKRSTVVNFAMGKSMLSFFNIMHAFFFIPFSITLLKNGYNPAQVLCWFLAMWAFIYCNNLLNTLINNKDNIFVIFIALLLGFGAMQYYGIFNVTTVTGPFYYSIFTTGYLVVVPLLILAGLWVATFKYFIKNMYLDTGLKGKHEIAKTENYTWLNRFGSLGTFLKNDIKMIRRNKRSKTTVFMSFAFLFYGLLFFSSGIEAYQNPMMQMFASIFVSGGFLFTFGQFVPSWDSAYYPLMMSQNIQYREYIASKWWLVVIGTLIGTVLSCFYLYYGINVYAGILVAAIYNIGVNSHLILLGGAYTKTPIDLASSKQAFGDKKAFNLQTFLLTIPKMLLPMGLYAAGYYTISPAAGWAFVGGAGVLGFAFRNKMFTLIEKVYKTEKYKALDAYKQKN